MGGDTAMANTHKHQGAPVILGKYELLVKIHPIFSDYRQPLQDLLKKDSEYCWLPVHDEAFKKLKSVILKDMTLK